MNKKDTVLTVHDVLLWYQLLWKTKFCALPEDSFAPLLAPRQNLQLLATHESASTWRREKARAPTPTNNNR